MTILNSSNSSSSFYNSFTSHCSYSFYFLNINISSIFESFTKCKLVFRLFFCVCPLVSFVSFSPTTNSLTASNSGTYFSLFLEEFLSPSQLNFWGVKLIFFFSDSYSFVLFDKGALFSLAGLFSKSAIEFILLSLRHWRVVIS